MIQIDDKLISEDIFAESFVCNLTKCKGACCVDGDTGAPLEKEELAILDDIFPKVKPYLRPEGVKAIEEQGTWVIDDYERQYGKIELTKAEMPGFSTGATVKEAPEQPMEMLFGLDNKSKK